MGERQRGVDLTSNLGNIDVKRQVADFFGSRTGGSYYVGRTICFPEFVQRLRGIPTASEDPYTKKLEVNVGFLGAAENISSHKLEL